MALARPADLPKEQELVPVVAGAEECPASPVVKLVTHAKSGLKKEAEMTPEALQTLLDEQWYVDEHPEGETVVHATRPGDHPEEWKRLYVRTLREYADILRRRSDHQVPALVLCATDKISVDMSRMLVLQAVEDLRSEVQLCEEKLFFVGSALPPDVHEGDCAEAEAEEKSAVGQPSNTSQSDAPAMRQLIRDQLGELFRDCYNRVFYDKWNKRMDVSMLKAKDIPNVQKICADELWHASLYQLLRCLAEGLELEHVERDRFLAYKQKEDCARVAALIEAMEIYDNYNKYSKSKGVRSDFAAKAGTKMGELLSVYFDAHRTGLTAKPVCMYAAITVLWKLLSTKRMNEPEIQVPLHKAKEFLSSISWPMKTSCLGERGEHGLLKINLVDLVKHWPEIPQFDDANMCGDFRDCIAALQVHVLLSCQWIERGQDEPNLWKEVMMAAVYVMVDKARDDADNAIATVAGSSMLTHAAQAMRKSLRDKRIQAMLCSEQQTSQLARCMTLFFDAVQEESVLGTSLGKTERWRHLSFTGDIVEFWNKRVDQLSQFSRALDEGLCAKLCSDHILLRADRARGTYLTWGRTTWPAASAEEICELFEWLVSKYEDLNLKIRGMSSSGSCKHGAEKVKCALMKTARQIWEDCKNDTMQRVLWQSMSAIPEELITKALGSLDHIIPVYILQWCQTNDPVQNLDTLAKLLRNVRLDGPDVGHNVAKLLQCIVEKLGVAQTAELIDGSGALPQEKHKIAWLWKRADSQTVLRNIGSCVGEAIQSRADSEASRRLLTSVVIIETIGQDALDFLDAVAAVIFKTNEPVVAVDPRLILSMLKLYSSLWAQHGDPGLPLHILCRAAIDRLNCDVCPVETLHVGAVLEAIKHLWAEKAVFQRKNDKVRESVQKLASSLKRFYTSVAEKDIKRAEMEKMCQRRQESLETLRVAAKFIKTQEHQNFQKDPIQMLSDLECGWKAACQWHAALAALALWANSFKAGTFPDILDLADSRLSDLLGNLKKNTAACHLQMWQLLIIVPLVKNATSRKHARSVRLPWLYRWLVRDQEAPHDRETLGRQLAVFTTRFLCNESICDIHTVVQDMMSELQVEPNAGSTFEATLERDFVRQLTRDTAEITHACQDLDVPCDQQLIQCGQEAMDFWTSVLDRVEVHLLCASLRELQDVLAKRLGLIAVATAVEEIEKELKEQTLLREDAVKCLPGFSSNHHMKLLMELGHTGMHEESSPVVRVMRTDGMRELLSALREQGSEVKWLDYLEMLYYKVAPWLCTASTETPTGNRKLLQSFCTNLHTALPSKESCENAMEALAVVRAHIDEIEEAIRTLSLGSDVVEQLRSFVGQLKGLKDHGTLEFVRDKDGFMGLQLRMTGSDEVRSWTYLQEIERRAALFMPSVEKESAMFARSQSQKELVAEIGQARLVRFFVEVHRQALRLLELMRELDQDGEPTLANGAVFYLKLAEVWDGDATAPSNHLDKICTAMYSYIIELRDSWRQQRAEEIGRCPRLSFLLPGMMLDLIHVNRIADTEAKRRVGVQRLLWRCFPDVERTIWFSQPPTFEQAFVSGMNTARTQLAAPSDISSAVALDESTRKCTADVLARLSRHILNLCDVFGGPGEQKANCKKYVYRLPRDTPDRAVATAWVLTKHAQRNDESELAWPHMAQILRCTAHTTWEGHLRSLLEAPWGDRPLFLLDVDLLHESVFKQLLQREHACQQDGQGRTKADIVFIFTEHANDSECKQLLQDRPMSQLDSEEEMLQYLSACVQPDTLSKLCLIEAIEVYRGSSGSGKSTRAGVKWATSGRAGPRFQLVVDIGFSVVQLISCLEDLVASAEALDQWRLCIHLVVEHDCCATLVSNMLLSLVLQGALFCDAGSGAMWTKPKEYPELRLTLQVEFAEHQHGQACIKLPVCDLFGHEVTPKSFQLSTAAELQAGALQLHGPDELNEFVALMRTAVIAAERTCLKQPPQQVFAGVPPGKLPCRGEGMQDGEIPSVVMGLCAYFQVAVMTGDPSHESGEVLREDDFRHMAQFCRLLAVKFELLTKLKRDARTDMQWRLEVVIKECLVTTMGWAQWDLTNPNGPQHGSIELGVEPRFGLFRQPLVFSFLKAWEDLPEVEDDNRAGEGFRLQRRCAEEYMFVNIDERQSFPMRALVACEKTPVQITVDYSNPRDGDKIGGETRGVDKFKTYTEHKQKLRQKLGIALDLDDTGESLHMLEKQQFVLTADVVAKAALFVMRMQIGLNIILQGHTGVGKTEIMELLQHFFAQRRQNMVFPSRICRLDQLKSLFNDVGVPICPKKSLCACVEAWHDAQMPAPAVADEAVHAEQANAQLENLRTLHEGVVGLINMLPQPNSGHGKQLMPADTPLASVLAHVVDDVAMYEAVEPKATYFYELIHPGVTQQKLEDIVAAACDAARFWHGRACRGMIVKLKGTSNHRYLAKDGMFSTSDIDHEVQWRAVEITNVAGRKAFTLESFTGESLCLDADGVLKVVAEGGEPGHFMLDRLGLLCGTDGQKVQVSHLGQGLETVKVDKIYEWSGKPWAMHSRGSFQPVILFLDELNTAKHLLAMINTVFSDRLYKGEALPPNLFCIGAINPLKKEAATFTVHQLPHALKSLLVDFGELDNSIERKFLYSMLSPVDDTSTQLEADVETRGEMHLQAVPPQLRFRIGEAILQAHQRIKQFIKDDKGSKEPDAMSECHIVTIRDMLRCVKIFLWLLQMLPSCKPFEELEKTERWEWSAVFALIITYSMRLPKYSKRCAFIDELAPLFKDLQDPEKRTWSQFVQCRFGALARWVSEQARDELRAVELGRSHDRTRRADHIILYRILDENLLAAVLGLDVDMPVMITAPPGHSKTYSITMVHQVLQTSPNGRRTDFFKSKPQLMKVFNYQGSNLSRAEQLMQANEDAKRYAEERQQGRLASKFRRKVSLLIDEAGLISGVVLKYLHSVLEEKDVIKILLANQQLDAAKTNRVLQLRQFDITADDLRSLISGALHGGDGTIGCQSHANSVQNAVDGAIKTFWTEDSYSMELSGEVHHRGIQQVPKWKETYHLRDLLWLLLYLRHYGFMDEVIQQKWREAAEILTMGVLRNFGGLPEESTCRLLDWAFRCVKTALGKCLPGSRDLLDADFKSCFQSSQGVAGEQRKTQRRQLSVLHALKESLRDNAEPSDDLNHTWYRYIMAIVQGGCSTHSLLREAFPDLFVHEVLEESSAAEGLNHLADHDDDMSQLQLSRLSLSDFPEEVGVGDECLTQARAKADVDMVLQVCQRMEFPGLCICSNFDRITTSFFHVLNRNFKRGIQPERGYPTYKAEVSIGSSSDQKLVNPQFKFVVEIQDSIDKTEMALRNRTEKYLLDTFQVLMWRLEHACANQPGSYTPTMPPDVAVEIKAAVQKVEQWAMTQGGGLTFCGFVPNNTVPSIMLKLLHRMEHIVMASKAWGNLYELLYTAWQESKVDGSDDWQNTDFKEQERQPMEAGLVFLLKFYLVQIALPFQVTKNCMSKERDTMLGKLYFECQEHMSWDVFIKKTVAARLLAMSERTRRNFLPQKVVVFTEPCVVLATPENLKRYIRATIKPIVQECKVGVLDLSTMRRRQVCADTIRAAFNSFPGCLQADNIYHGKPSTEDSDQLHVLAILVNARDRHFQCSQLAYVRAEVDRHMQGGSNVLVMCFVAPSTTLLRKGAVASLWLDGWDFHVLDPHHGPNNGLHEDEAEIAYSNVRLVQRALDMHTDSSAKDTVYPEPRFNYWVERHLEILAQKFNGKAQRDQFIIALLDREACKSLGDAGLGVAELSGKVLPDGQDPPTSFSQVFRLQDMPDKGRKRQRALLTQLLGWNHGVAQKAIFERLCSLLQQGELYNLLLDLCKMRDTPASLSKSLWDALDNWVQQRTLFFITKYVTSLPVSLLPSNGQGADVMHRLIVGIIKWAHPPKQGSLLEGKNHIYYRFCRIPCYALLDTYLQRLAMGPVMAVDDTSVLTSVIDLHSDWASVRDDMQQRILAQSDLQPVLRDLSSPDLFRAFCQDALAYLFREEESQRWRWSSESMNFVRDLLCCTSQKLAPEMAELHPLFVHWFLKKHSRLVLDILSISDLLPPDLLQNPKLQGSVFSAEVVEDLLSAIIEFSQSIDIDVLKDKLTPGLMAACAAVLRGLHGEAAKRVAGNHGTEAATGSRDRLGRASLDATLLAVSWSHLSLNASQLRETTVLTRQLRQTPCNDMLSLLHLYLQNGLKPTLLLSRQETVESTSRVAVLMLDQCSSLIEKSTAAEHQDRANANFALAKHVLQLAKEKLISGSALHVLFSKSFLQAAVKLSDFWEEVCALAEQLGLSGLRFAVPSPGLPLDDIWQGSWEVADELGRWRVRTLLDYTYKGEDLEIEKSKKLALKWLHEVGEGPWPDFERGAHYAAAVEALVQAVHRALNNDDIDTFLQSVRKDAESLSCVQKLLEGVDEQVRFMHLLGQDLRTRLTREKQLLQQLRLADWADDSDRNSNELFWFSSRWVGPEQDLVKALLDCVAGPVGRALDDLPALQALQTYIAVASPARARFVFGTLVARFARQGSAECGQRLQQLLGEQAVMRLLDLTDPTDYRLSILTILCHPRLTDAADLQPLRDLWTQSHGGGEGRMMSFAYALSFLAAAPKNASFMHFRFFVQPLQASMNRGLAGVGSHGFRCSNSLKDCGYRTWESAGVPGDGMFPVTPTEFDGSAEGRAWGCYLTWAAMAAALVHDSANMATLQPYLQAGLQLDYASWVGVQAQIRHILDRMDSFLNVVGAELQQQDGWTIGAVLGSTLWQYLLVCGERQAAHLQFLVHEVSVQDLPLYESFLFRAVYTVGKTYLCNEERKLLNASQEKRQKLVDWQSATACRSACDPARVKLRDVLPHDPDETDTAQMVRALRLMIDGEQVARISALRLLAPLSRLGLWLKNLISTYVESEVIDAEGSEHSLHLGHIKAIVLERLPSESARLAVDKRFNELCAVWNELRSTCSMREACQDEGVLEIPETLEVPLAHLLVSQGTRGRKDADNNLPTYLSTLTTVNNDVASALGSTELGKSRNVGRTVLDCPLIPFTPAHLLTRTLFDPDLTRFAPLFLSGGECAHPRSLDVPRFMTVVMDAGVCNCVQLPLLAELKRWLQLEPLADLQLPCWDALAAVPGSAMPAMFPPPCVSGPRRGVCLPPELHHLQRCYSSIHETTEGYEHLRGTLCSGSDTEAMQRVLGFLAEMEPTSENIDNLARQLSEAVQGISDSIDWDVVSPKALQRTPLNDAKNLPYGLGKLFISDLPSILAALGVLAVQTSHSRELPAELTSELSPHARAELKKRLGEAAAEVRRTERSATADALAQWYDMVVEEQLQRFIDEPSKPFGRQAGGAATSSSSAAPTSSSFLPPAPALAADLVEVLERAAQYLGLENRHTQDILRLVVEEIAALNTPIWAPPVTQVVHGDDWEVVDIDDIDLS